MVPPLFFSVLPLSVSSICIRQKLYASCMGERQRGADKAYFRGNCIDSCGGSRTGDASLLDPLEFSCVVPPPPSRGDSESVLTLGFYSEDVECLQEDEMRLKLGEALGVPVREISLAWLPCSDSAIHPSECRISSSPGWLFRADERRELGEGTAEERTKEEPQSFDLRGRGFHRLKHPEHHSSPFRSLQSFSSSHFFQPPLLDLQRDWGCLLTLGGMVKCWGGRNEGGQLGKGHTRTIDFRPDQLSPVNLGYERTGDEIFGKMVGTFCLEDQRIVADIYTSFSEARQACQALDTCGGIYDDNCDSTGTFFLCKQGYKSSPSDASCVYKKFPPEVLEFKCTSCEICNVAVEVVNGSQGEHCLDECEVDPLCLAAQVRLEDYLCMHIKSQSNPSLLGPQDLTCIQASDFMVFTKKHGRKTGEAPSILTSSCNDGDAGFLSEKSVDSDFDTYWLGERACRPYTLDLQLAAKRIILYVEIVTSFNDRNHPEEILISDFREAGSSSTCEVTSHGMLSSEKLDDSLVKLFCPFPFESDRLTLSIGKPKFENESPRIYEIIVRAFESLPLQRATFLQTGTAHACAILLAGKVKCWGDNTYGQLGYGDSNNRGDETSPEEMGNELPFLPLLSEAREVALGYQSSCVLLEEGWVQCVGINLSGQLGHSKDYSAFGKDPMRTETSSSSGGGATQIEIWPLTDLGEEVIQIAGMHEHYCALLRSQSVKCWGANSYGQLGLGDRLNRGSGVGDMGRDLPALELNLVQKIDVGLRHSCALTLSGDVWCWGSNEYGQVSSTSNKTESILLEPVLASTTAQSRLCLSQFTSCSLQGMALSCWGREFGGATSDPLTTSSASMFIREERFFDVENTATDLVCGVDAICGVMQSGQIFCSGYSGSSRSALGLGIVEDAVVPLQNRYPLFGHDSSDLNRFWKIKGACKVILFLDTGCIIPISPSYTTERCGNTVENEEDYSVFGFDTRTDIKCVQPQNGGTPASSLSLERFDGLRFEEVWSWSVSFPSAIGQSYAVPWLSGNTGLAGAYYQTYSCENCQEGVCYKEGCACTYGWTQDPTSSSSPPPCSLPSEVLPFLHTTTTPTPSPASLGPSCVTPCILGECVDDETCECREDAIGKVCDRTCPQNFLYKKCYPEVYFENPGSPLEASQRMCKCDGGGNSCSTFANRGCCNPDLDSRGNFCHCAEEEGEDGTGNLGVWGELRGPQGGTWRFCEVGWWCARNSGVSGNNHISRTGYSFEQCKEECLSSDLCRNFEFDQSRTSNGICQISFLAKEESGWNDGTETDYILCEPRIDPCPQLDCGRHGTCDPGFTSIDTDPPQPTCVCSDGYTGRSGEEPIVGLKGQ